MGFNKAGLYDVFQSRCNLTSGQAGRFWLHKQPGLLTRGTEQRTKTNAGERSKKKEKKKEEKGKAKKKKKNSATT